MDLLFDCVESSMRNGSIKKETLEWIGVFIKSSFKFELGEWVNASKEKGKKVADELVELIFDQI